MEELRRELGLLVRSRYPVIWLLTHEEERAERLLQNLGRDLQRKVVFWSCSRGFEAEGARADAALEPTKGLKKILQSPDRVVFVLKDFHAFLEDPTVVRRLRDIVRELRSSYKSLVILSPILKIPVELEKDVTVCDLPLPTAKELTTVLQNLLGSVKQKSSSVAITSDPALVERVASASLGLTEGEAENIYAKAVVSGASFSEQDLSLIIAEKKQILRKTGLLEYFDLDQDLSSVGGLRRLKIWLDHRRDAFSERASRYGLPPPRGVLLLGVQGCGKSLTAKAVATQWQMPLLRLDVGAIFNSFIGASEENVRKAIKVAESLAPAVLWVDEIEKGFAGVRSSGSVDAGVTARVFASFLTWLQEKTCPVFVVATANQVKSLPPELLRKGRFDEIFFVDLPSEKERRDILGIQIRKRNRDPGAFDLEALAARSEGFSGAELEEAVVAALYATFPLNRDIATEDLATALDETVPLSRTMKEEVEGLREWARSRARPAS